MMPYLQRAVGICLLFILVFAVFALSACALNNNDPVIEGLQVETGQVILSGSSGVECRATDPDGDEMAYSWSATGGLFSQETGPVTTWMAPHRPGSYRITVTVTDGRGGEATQESVIRVIDNTPPEIELLNAKAPIVNRGQSTVIRCLAVDQDGDNLEYLWTATGGDIEGQGLQATWQAPDEIGAFVITVQVLDGRGGEVGSKFTIEVVDNETPIIESLTAEPQVVSQGGITSIQCNAVDEDDDALAYGWAITRGMVSGTGPLVEWTAPYVAGIYTATVTVKDGRGGEVVGQVDIEVLENRPPSVNRLIVEDYTVGKEGTVDIECVATDPEGNTLKYKWTSSGGDVSGQGSAVTWRAPSVAGSFTITVRVTDGRGGEASREVTIEVEEHG